MKDTQIATSLLDSLDQLIYQAERKADMCSNATDLSGVISSLNDARDELETVIEDLETSADE